MRFACIGGDRRQTEIAKYLKEKQHEVCLFGLPKSEGIESTDSLCEAICGADAVILPVPLSRDDKTVNTPLTGDVIFLQDILQCSPKFIFAGLISPGFAKELSDAGIEFKDYYKSESLTVKNAVLTAEAAVAIAVTEAERSLFGTNALVIGYGRIGKQLARYLKAMGARVTATSRSDGTMATIEADGYEPLNTTFCKNEVHNFDFIFNTAPSPIMDSEFFMRCKKGCFVEDLATKAGTDFGAAAKYSVKAALYSGLPGKYSPVTAAECIADELLNNSNIDFRENGG